VGVISIRIDRCYFPLPFIPSHVGRGKFITNPLKPAAVL
jgi:hypothetical protein